jgi:2',3'-cyclic-nucleotide 2'-phosphodiesterase (5'-nucleotidase family)
MALHNGLRVAVIGLAPQVTAPESWWSRVTHFVFDDPEKTAAGLAAKLRNKADLIVLLSHCGLEIDRRLAQMEEIDLVLGGHSHKEAFEQKKGAPLLHSGHLGRSIARAEVTVECGKVTKVEASVIPLGKANGA